MSNVYYLLCLPFLPDCPDCTELVHDLLLSQTSLLSDTSVSLDTLLSLLSVGDPLDTSVGDTEGLALDLPLPT